jgi:glucokinase
MSQADSIQSTNLDSLLKTKMPALGIDLGGTKLSAAVVSEGSIVDEPVQISTPDTAKKIIDAIVNLIAPFQKDNILAGVGIATAGIVNRDTGEITGSTGNLPGWTGTPLKTIIESRTMLPVEVENDANAAAFGESKARNLESKKCVIVVTLGTGIGGGMLIGGKLFHGAHWAAGECGHIRVSLENKRLCTCGLFDCWEAFGSANGMIMTARELATGISPEQSSLARDSAKVTTRLIVAAAEAGDIVAKKTLDLWHLHIAVGLVTLVHALDPDCIILAGGLSQIVDYQLLKELVLDRTLQRSGEQLEIYQSKLGNNAGMIGAAELLLDSLLTQRH